MIRFAYTPKDLCLEVHRSSSEKLETGNDDFDNNKLGREADAAGSVEKDFDETLRHAWEEAQKKGYFNYPATNDIPSRILPGKFSYIAQLHLDRALKRRKPQQIQCHNQPFNPNDFNFNKANPREIIISLEFMDERAHPYEPKRVDSNFILINVSPIEYGHVLIVPNMSGNEAQRVTLDGLKLALEVLLLNKSCDFRVGVNSLCGFASVNHHHYHAYYLNHRLFLEHAELDTLAGPCHVLSDPEFPAQGFVFILKNSMPEGIKTFLREAMRVISYLQENNIAHNFFMTRASTRHLVGHFDSVRIYIWGRSSSFGAKECDGFNPGLCELGGHLLMKNESSYASMSETKICDELRNLCQEIFCRIRPDISSLYE